MNALLTPEQIDRIKKRDAEAHTHDSVSASQIDRRALLRDREAIAERLEEFARRLGDDFDSVEAVNEVENDLRALVTAIRGEKG